MATVYYSKYVLAPDFSIITNGAVAVENEMIVAAGSRNKVKRNIGDKAVNLGDVLLMPGLINMHIHLEENLFRGISKEPDETFASWSIKKYSRLKNAEPSALRSSIRLAIRELLTNGITTVVDTSRTAESVLALQQEPIRGFVIHDIHSDMLAVEQQALLELQQRISTNSIKIGLGVGPYAIFSLSIDGHLQLQKLALEHGLLWATHLAESAEELQAFTEHGGDLYFHVTRRKSWPFEKNHLNPIQVAIQHNLIPQGAICIHCNYADGAALQALAQKNASIVTCFRYNEFAGHKNLALDVARNRGINLCVGTEMDFNSSSISIFDELHYLKKYYPHITAAEMLKWVTINPAKALASKGKLGVLETGAYADFIGVKVAHSPDADLLEELLMEQPEVKFVVVNGEEIIVNY